VSEKKGWGKTVLGWFVVQEGDEAGGGPKAGEDPDALIARYANEAPPPPVTLDGPLPPVVNGQVDFTSVFESGGVDAAERDQVQKAQELLRSLPAETPGAVKKQIVEAALKAFGVPTDKIIEAAVGEMQALESFIRVGQADTQKVLADGAQRTKDLEAEIANVKKAMEQSVGEQEARTRAANAEKLKVQQVLEFFGQEAVARVVKESPKLVSPSDAH
jgi:hypothetical protein